MRKELRDSDTEYFVCNFEKCVPYRFRGQRRYAFLFSNITDKNGKHLTDHVWVKAPMIKDILGDEMLDSGQKVKIYAEVDMYIKGYKGKKVKYKSNEMRLDYTIRNIQKVVKM